MERVYRMLLAMGYPQEGIVWMRKHRAAAIIVMAITAWAFFIVLGWLAWSVLSRAFN